MNINGLIEKYANESQTLKLHLRRFSIDMLEMVKTSASSAIRGNEVEGYECVRDCEAAIDKALEELRK